MNFLKQISDPWMSEVKKIFPGSIILESGTASGVFGKIN
jgi:hypothetical protein